MCGIAGILGMGRSSEGAVRDMMHALEHRGPDDSGSWSDDSVALGHRRLAVIDLSARGHQPMTSADGRYVIVYNGEVFNFRSLRARLEDRGHSFRSDTDTEVVLAAYVEWGEGFVERLIGMFAFAIYDRDRGDVLLVRDRLGIKPLYVYSADGTTVFASEIRALLASGLVPRDVDLEALSEFLIHQTVPTPATLIRGVEMLRPGTMVRVSNRKIEEREYWNLLKSADQEAATHSAEEAARGVRERLWRAVERRLVADVPLGAFLSGGIDSTTVVAVMRQVAGADVRTFTVAFDDPSNADASFARQVARHLGTAHTEIRLKEEELLDQIPRALNALDHPSADGINTYLISQAVRRAGLTVALSGLGGDEVFCGYDTFRRLRMQYNLRYLWRTPLTARRAFSYVFQRAYPGHASFRLSQVLCEEGSLTSIYPLMRQFFSPDDVRQLIDRPHQDPCAYSRLLQESFDGAPCSSLMTRISFAESRTYMHDVLLRDTDQMSMAHALEVRVPLLDHELVEYVMGLPDRLKEPRGIPKRLLVLAQGGLVSTAVNRRSKQGFSMPFDSWMRGPLRELCETRLALLGDAVPFDRAFIKQRWHDFLDDARGTRWSRIWLLVALGHWIDRNVTGPIVR